MTHEGTGDAAVLEQPEVPEVTPVPVQGEFGVVGRVTTAEEAADFGTYRTIVLVGNEARQQILPYDIHRVRAWIMVSGTGPVWIGSEAQCVQVSAGNTGGGGAQLAAGGPAVLVGHKQPVWLVPDGSHSATVVVIQERMRG